MGLAIYDFALAKGRGNFSGQGRKFANGGLNSRLSLGLHKAKAGEDTRGPRDAGKNYHTLLLECLSQPIEPL